MTTLLGGLVVGLLAGVALQLLDDDPSAATVVLARLVDDRTATSRGPELAAAVAYGGLAGLALLALELYALGVLAVPPSFAEAFGVALAWAAVLFVV